MAKRVISGLMSLLIVISFVFAGNIQKPTKNKVDAEKVKRIGYLTPDGTNIQFKNIPSPLKSLGVKPGKVLKDAQPVKNPELTGNLPETDAFVDYIAYFDWPPEVRFIFGPYDSVAVWFRPVTQCSLLSILIVFTEDAVGMTYNVEIRRVAEHLNGVYDFRYGTESGGEDMRLFDQNWTGRLMGSYELTVPSSDEWIEIPINAFGLSEEDINIALNDFAVLWQFPPETDPNAAELYADMPSPFNHHGFKWYVNGHPALDGQVGWVARWNFSIIAKVLYYGDPPPTITDLNDIADQYESINPGPYTVTATVSDLGTDVFTGYVRRVALIMDDNDDPYDAPNDTVWVFVDEPGGDEYSEVSLSYDIPNPGVGNSVYYWWYAEDNGAENTADPEAKTHVTVSEKFHFTVREKNPDATILLVDDSGGQGLVSQYTDALDAFGFVYDLWDTQDGDSTSLEILSLYNTIIWFTGTGRGGWFNLLTETQIAPYLDAGGNLFFSSSDFVGVRENFSGDQWTTWVTPTDPFVVDYLKVSEIIDDANAIRGDMGWSADTMYTGIIGTLTEVVADTFEADMLDYGYSDWSGEVIPSEGTTILQVFSAELDDWDETAGYMYSGTYNLVYLPWCFESIHRGDIRVQLLSLFLGEFFGENAAPVFSNFDGSRYSVIGNGPFPVSVDVVDNDGSVQSVELGYSIDGGDYTWIPMSDDGTGTYTAMIPALTSDDTLVAYTVRATDDLGKTRYHTDVYWFERVDFQVENPGGLLVVVDNPYDWWHGVSVDTLATDPLDDLGVPYDFWDADMLGMMDAKTVLSNYHTVFWASYMDWDPTLPYYSMDNPLAEFVDNGGKLFYSSEEMLGTWTDWENTAFGPGDFAFDYLNITYVYHDWGYDSLNTRMDSLAFPITDGLDSIVVLSQLHPALPIFSDYIEPRTDVPLAFPFFGWAGFYYYSSTMTSNVIFLPFNVLEMDSTNRSVLFDNVLNYFDTPVSISDDVANVVPKQYMISQNYPNPFNPITNIQFALPKKSEVRIVIYNMLGQKVKTLVDGFLSPGKYEITWDGRDESGRAVASGVYIYKFETPEYVASKKMVLLK